MAPVRHALIAREGWPVLAVVAVLAWLSAWLGGLWASSPWLLLLVAVLFLFRDPRRRIPALPLAVLSPVDGRVEHFTRTDDALLGCPAWRIRLRMARLGVFSVRSPIEGKVQAPDIDHAVMVCTDEGDRVLWRVEGHPWFAPRCYLQPGERVGQGQRCGFALLAREVELLVPASSRLEIHPGQRLRAGESILATLVHAPGTSAVDNDVT